MMKRFLFAGIAIIMFSLAAGAQTPQPVASSPGNASPTAGGVNALWQETFDICWQKVRDTHYDPTFGGVDWEQVRRKYEPRLVTLRNDAELHRMLQAMLSELGQSHFNVIPPEAVLPDENRADMSAGIGIDLRVIDDRVVISRVDKGSTAAAAGLRPGFIIDGIGSRDLDTIKAQLASSTEPEERKRLWLIRRIMAEIGGAPETTVRIVYLDSREQRAEAVIRRERLKGELSPPIGNFPPQYTEFESARLPGNIGYIRFNIFTTPVMQKIRNAMKGFSGSEGGSNGPVAGIIFDLRGNPGGVGGMASGIAGMLTTETGSLGSMKMRTSELKFAYFPQQNAFTGPVAILIDGFSASTSEIFAAGLQETGRAAIFGEKSMGAALPSYIFKLPTGALLQYAIADFKTPKGVLVEGRGVVPDLEIKLDRASLLAGRDSQFEAAIDYIKTRSKSSK